MSQRASMASREVPISIPSPVRMMASTLALVSMVTPRVRSSSAMADVTAEKSTIEVVGEWIARRPAA